MYGWVFFLGCRYKSFGIATSAAGKFSIVWQFKMLVERQECKRTHRKSCFISFDLAKKKNNLVCEPFFSALNHASDECAEKKKNTFLSIFRIGDWFLWRYVCTFRHFCFEIKSRLFHTCCSNESAIERLPLLSRK